MTTLRDSLANVAHAATPRPRIVERNTFAFTTPLGFEVIRLHLTNIIARTNSGRIVQLDSGGWRTMTTRDRINTHSRGHFRVTADRNGWTVHETESSPWRKPGAALRSAPFFDGMELPKAFGSGAAKAASEKVRLDKLAADIKRFAAKVSAPYPEPSPGDCWCCMAESGSALSETSYHGFKATEIQRKSGADHLLEHVREGYLHGTLICNAVTAAGLNPAYLYMSGGRSLFDEKRVRRMVTRYLRARLGLPV